MIIVEPGIEDQRLKGCLRITGRGRDPRNDCFQHLRYPFAFFGTDGQRISGTGGRLGNEVFVSNLGWYPAVSYGPGADAFLVTWDYPPPSGPATIGGQRYAAATGALLGSFFTISPNSSDRSTITHDDGLGRWLESTAPTADAVIASLDMLCYGGLIAARTTADPTLSALTRLDLLGLSAKAALGDGPALILVGRALAASTEAEAVVHRDAASVKAG